MADYYDILQDALEDEGYQRLYEEIGPQWVDEHSQEIFDAATKRFTEQRLRRKASDRRAVRAEHHGLLSAAGCSRWYGIFYTYSANQGGVLATSQEEYFCSSLESPWRYFLPVRS